MMSDEVFVNIEGVDDSNDENTRSEEIDTAKVDVQGCSIEHTDYRVA